MTDISDEIRTYWDEDAATYDRSPGHGAHSPTEQAAWTGALARLLPSPPARVLDVGAGTGFLALPVAALGHRVTALDVSQRMLAGLADKAGAHGLTVDTIVGDASSPPEGPFDVVIERHVVWTLPDPAAALRAWRAVAPGGRLILVESMWGRGADRVESVRDRARQELRRLRRTPADHHSEYSEEMRRALPLAGGTTPDRLVDLVESAGWGPARLQRLYDVEWAMTLAQPMPEQLLGVTPRFAVVGGA